MRTLALTIAYDGTDWSGFQRLRGAPTIQAAVEEALAKVLQHSVTVMAAGRTDAGVHAMGQVVSLHTCNPMPLDRIGWVTNRLLPPSIRIRKAVEREANFHARFGAAYRRYWYVIQKTGHPEPIGGRFRWQLPYTLNRASMEESLLSVHGTHDFDALCHRGTPGGSTIRTIHRAIIRNWSGGIVIDVQANAFLHQMMRLLVANVIVIGRGERPVTWLSDLVRSKNRHLAGVAAPPCGLFLMRIGYPPSVNPRWGTLLEKLNDEELSG